MKSKLTPKQELFVDAYVGKAKGNATEAARIAGYKGSKHTLQSVGAENLSKPVISQAVQKRLATAKKTCSADEVLAELTTVALAPWKDFCQVEMDGGQVVGATLLLKDKLKALELLGKFHKLFTEKHVHEDAEGKPLPVLNITCA